MIKYINSKFTATFSFVENQRIISPPKYPLRSFEEFATPIKQ